MKRVDSWGVPVLLGLAMLANAAMVPLVPYALATRLGWPLWLVGAYSFAVMVVTMTVNQRFSSIVDTAKRRSILCLVCGAFQVAGALAAMAALNGAVWLLVLAVLGTAVGGAAAPIYYTLGRLITQADCRDSSTVNSVLRVVTSAAWVVGPAISFAVVGSGGITAAFVVIATMAGVGAVVVLIAASWLDERSARGSQSPPADPAAGSGSALPGFADRVLPHLSAFVVVFLFSFAHISTATSLPLLLVRRFSVPESATGLLLGLKAAMEMVTILATPLLMRRWGARMTLTVAGAGALVAYGSYLLGSGLTGALIGSVAEGAYYGVFAATALTWVQSLPGMRLGRATGFYMNGIYAGVLIGAPVSGIVASYNLGGIAALSLIAAVGASVALQAAFGIARARQNPQEE
jgi:SET family sugar efflux transporter-like MFS transporter